MAHEIGHLLDEYDVNADGSRFLVNRMVSAADPSMAIILDWNPSR